MNDNLRTQISNLSVSEKIILVEEIWDSIASQEKSFDLSDSQKNIVKERSSSFKNNPKLGRSWEEIRAEFLGKK
jgi:putative addiction module component (TIGR02574 family)